MKKVFFFLVLIGIISQSILGVYVLGAQAEDSNVQIIMKEDPYTKKQIEFRVQLYSLSKLDQLVPSVGEYRDEGHSYEKYLFCTVKNLSDRHAIHLRFVVLGTDPKAIFKSPEIAMPWLGPNAEHYSLVPVGSPYFQIPDAKVKLDVKIIDLKRK